MTTSKVSKVLLKRGNTAQNNAYTGVYGELSIDMEANNLRIHDGVLAGGNIVSGAGGSSYTDSNVNAYLTSFDGNIIPSANVLYSLGSTTHWWKDLYLSGNTIHIGGATLSVVGGEIQTSVPISANLTATNITVQGTRIEFASGGYIEESEVLDGSLQPAGYYGIALNSSDDGIISMNALDSNAAVTSSVFVTNVAVQLNVANSIQGGSAHIWYFDNVGGVTFPDSSTQTTAFTGFSGYATDASVTAANIGMKGYVDNAVATSGYSNVQVATYLPTYTGNISAGNITVNTGAYKLGTAAAKISTDDNTSILLTPDTGANALAGVKIGGSGYLLGPNGSRNITLNYGGGSGVVGLQANVTVGTASTSTLTVNGNTVTGNLSATGSITTSGINGKIGYSSGGYVVQSGNASGVVLNTISGNIKLDSVSISTNGTHTVALTNNKLDANDIILVQVQGTEGLDLLTGAYYLTTSTALIYLRNISGSSIGPIAPMLKFIIVKAPGA